MRAKLVFVLLLGAFLAAHGQPLQKPVAAKPVIAKKQLKLDSSKVEVRNLDTEAIEAYSKQKEFKYDVAPERLSWWDRFWRWVWWVITSIFQSGNGKGGVLLGILKYLIITVLVLLVAFGVIKLLGLDLKMLARKPKAIEVPYEESLENIHEIDFDEQLEKAIQDGNYRLAVRLLYLRTLKHLSDLDMINWQPDKTNQAYVSEVKNDAHRKEFAQLTSRFEYVWYGEFFIDKGVFEPISQSFQQFNQHAK